MNVEKLAGLLEKAHPETDPSDIARLCTVLLNSIDDLDELKNEDRLKEACRESSLRLQFATDQHAAMTQELEDLAASDPKKFSSEQIWILVRAIKVQSQVLQMYLGGEALDV